jgi:hypothetical protein
MWSSSGVLAAVDVKDFSGNKLGFFEEDDGMDNLVYVTQTAHGMQSRKLRVCFNRMHRGLDDARRYGVDPDPAACVLGGEGLRRRIQPALCQGSEHRRHVGARLVGESGGDVDDVPGARCFHEGDGPLADMEKSGEIDRYELVELGGTVFSEGLGQELTGIVDDRVYTAETLHGCLENPIRGLRVGNVTPDDLDTRIFHGLDASCGSNDVVVPLQKLLDKASTNSL